MYCYIFQIFTFNFIYFENAYGELPYDQYNSSMTINNTLESAKEKLVDLN